MKSRVAWGIAAIGAYIVVAVALNTAVAPRVLFDGLAPPASYRYASPPPDLTVANEPPEPGSGQVELTKKGSQAATISTGDGQMLVVLPERAFERVGKEKDVDVHIKPLVPQEPLDVEGGLVVEGNAYEIAAWYGKSTEPATLALPATIVARYPVTGTVILRREGNAWRKLETQASPQSLQLFGDTDRLGIFATAGAPHRPRRTWLPYAAGAAGVVAGVGGYLWGRRSGRRRKKKVRKPRRRRP
jgi:hypothetical protein